MGIWLELGVFGIFLVFAFWQMHDVRKAQEQTRLKRAKEKAQAQALAAHRSDQARTPPNAADPGDSKSV